MTPRGRPRWYKPDTGLAARMVFTILLLGLVYVVFAFLLGAVLGVPLPYLVIGALIIGGIQLFFADKIARHPESLGIGGVVSPSSGLKEAPSSRR